MWSRCWVNKSEDICKYRAQPEYIKHELRLRVLMEVSPILCLPFWGYQRVFFLSKVDVWKRATGWSVGGSRSSAITVFSSATLRCCPFCQVWPVRTRCITSWNNRAMNWFVTSSTPELGMIGDSGRTPWYYHSFASFSVSLVSGIV